MALVKPKTKATRYISRAEALERVNKYVADFTERDLQFLLRYRWDLKTFTFTVRQDAHAVRHYFPEFDLIADADGSGFYAQLDINFRDIIHL